MRNLIVAFVISAFLLSGCKGQRGDTTLVAPAIDSSTTPNEFLEFINNFVDPSSGQSAIDSQSYADAYYAAVDPLNERTTLADWKTKNGFSAGTDVHATFRDVKDLGYGRDMYARTGDQQDVIVAPAMGTPDCTGITAIYVNNYVVELQPGDATAYGPLNLQAAISHDSRYLTGTNAIEFSPEDPNDCSSPKIAKFFTFAPPDASGVQHRLDSADLDGRGVKFMPTTCMTCHGGIMYPPTVSGDFNPVSLKSPKLHILEKDTFGFSTQAGYTAMDQESPIRDLNKMVFDTYVEMGNRADSNASNDRANWDSTFAESLIELAYGDPTPGDHTLVQNTGYQGDQVPTGWLNPAPPATPEEDRELLYREVMAPHCIGCHSLRGTKLSSYIDFSDYSDLSNYNDQIIRYVYQYAAMPRSLINYTQFWEDPATRPTLLAAHLDFTNFPALDPASNAIQRPGRAVALPGADRTVTAANAIQDASASPFSSSYLWEVLSGNATVDGSNTATSPAPLIELTVADPATVDLQLITANSNGDSVASQVSVTIDNALTPANPTFVTDIMSIDGMAGIFGSNNDDCIACHSSGGGYDGIPVYYDVNDYAGHEKDLYRNVLNRVNLADPENSLLLNKPSGAVPHGGGTLLTPAQYNTILNWIRNGAPCGNNMTYCPP